MKVTQLTVKDNTINPAKLAHFLKENISDSSQKLVLKDYLELAKKMINGEAYIHDWELKVQENDMVNVSSIDILSEDEKAYIQMQEDRNYYHELKEKGANGDAQAAIEFCKAVQEGKYNNGAYA